MTPLIGLPADTGERNHQIFHSIGDKYVRAVAEAAGCHPVVIPALADALDLGGLLDRLDGLVMTGALSNVHPDRYGTTPSPDHEPYDFPRDDTTLALIPMAIERGMPVLCICRAIQELNVAMGGTLATEIQRGEGRLDHRAPQVEDVDVKYGPRHKLLLTPGGMLAGIMGTEEIMVNSLHRQAIDRLAPGLVVEGRAEDGTVEAVSVKGASGFALGVQWHPEFKATENPDSVKLFGAFGEAARAYGRNRAPRPAPAAL
ncbi:gamma-glutamyl-gamma-aminobutyrate hydrolase family protein [Kaustia mangrovi]|uniref:gamma-glutamyl-gamma-aminobutyrate hydrolase n=1 Tax=Kaustia mangrovi TaxID=2593653 RepID=A0A7S8HB82_9HYPH|nr:gamma-glutamyl-gamma-aminobutyrate hydrolase family protein [Kaustia mangrovi]QPC42226.1 gamma-glutamyl-gamma-aminobutyrate hydrolase family protein [Kaustia mangrovi]